MNSANRTTLIMLLLAAVSVVAAMIYYPWPEFAETDEEVGQPLFEAYEARNVRGIDIIEFDSDKSTIDRIKLNRRGEQWVVPAKQNFISSQTALIGAVINSLNDRVIYEVISENQEDHIKYGVVDPTEFSIESNVAALGKKLTLTDRNNQTIADLIVGSAVKNDQEKRYVRVPGKPRVYVIDFDARMLATKFLFWVSPNILALQTQQQGPGKQIREIQINNYQVTQNDKNSKPVRNSLYRASLVPSGGRLNIRSLEIPDGDNWKQLSVTPEQQVKLTNAAPFLIQMITDDVRRKSDELSESLQFPEDDVADEVFAKMPGFGFYRTGKKNGEWTFESANGQVSVTTTDGVKTNIFIGQVGTPNSIVSGKLNYFVMLKSVVDESLLKQPERPANIENDESEENKQYLRLVEQWKSTVDKARQASREFNAIHSDWYYLVNPDIIMSLRPDIPLPVITSNTTEEGESDNKSDANEESKEDQAPIDDK